MPDIEMFGLLAKEFHVSINDLLAGEKYQMRTSDKRQTKILSQ